MRAMRAEVDLEWFIASGDAAMGLRAQGYGPSASSSWDASRLAALHDSRTRPSHRRDVDRHRRVAACFEQLTPPSQRLALAAFTPRRWPPDVRRECGMVGETSALVGVVMMAHATLDAFAVRHGGRPPATRDELLEWLVAMATTKPVSRVFFDRLVAAARELFELEVMSPYRELAKAHVARARAERDDMLRGLRTGS